MDLLTLLHPHYEATAERLAAQPVVLAVQDTTSLNYPAHPATHDLEPINTRADGAQGLKLHDTLALTPQGLPLGLIDIQVWTRDPRTVGQAKQRKQRSLEAKESQRWLRSYRRTAEFQRLCPGTRLVNLADREADIYELFQAAAQQPDGPDLLIRASRTTQRQVDEEDEHKPLWDYLPTRPRLGDCEVAIPARAGHKARRAALEIRCAPIQLRPPKRLEGAPALSLWAIHAIEPQPPAGCEPLKWLLLTTVPTTTLEQALERLAWYAVRWTIEVFHRTLKSGCRIEDRRLGDAHSLQACLALDLVVAWRVMHLAKLGRHTPDVPCSVFFEEAEWKALHATTTAHPPRPKHHPPWARPCTGWLSSAASSARKGDGHPSATTLWRGLDRLADITQTFSIFHPSMPAGP